MRHLNPLNVDYKILAHTLAIKLKKFLSYVIGEQQTGFMENHCIQTNIRTTTDVVTQIYNSDKRAVMLSLEFGSVLIVLNMIVCLKLWSILI